MKSAKVKYVVCRMSYFELRTLPFIIDYFSVAQTSVLIGVNPCLTESYLKKQSQFAKEQNDVKSILIMVYGVFNGPRRRKNKANSKPISNAGSDAEWIPAFAGMTNMEILHDGKF